jgi:hypothetical protein
MPNAVEARGSTEEPVDYEAIEQAVLESKRGRWFLDEYARRLKRDETAALLQAIGKLEIAVTSGQGLLAERLAKALGEVAPAGQAPATLAPQHVKYFKQDEDIFEAPADPVIPAAPKPEMPKGAKLVIRHRTETISEPAPAAETVSLPAEPTFAQPATAEEAPKRRIVIIRHKAGEPIDVPLQDEIAASA